MSESKGTYDYRVNDPIDPPTVSPHLVTAMDNWANQLPDRAQPPTTAEWTLYRAILDYRSRNRP